MVDNNFAYFSKVLLSGACGGSLLTLTGHPLDTIKVNIQTMKQVNGKMPFNNAFDCAKKIVVCFFPQRFLRRFPLKFPQKKLIFLSQKAKNGIRGLYAGLGMIIALINKKN